MVSTRVDLTENRIFAQRQPRFVDTLIYSKKLPWLEKIDPTFKTVHHDNDLSKELGFAIYGPIDRPFFVGTFEEINRHKEYFLMYLWDLTKILTGLAWELKLRMKEETISVSGIRELRMQKAKLSA